MRDTENRNNVQCKSDKIRKMTEVKTTKIRKKTEKRKHKNREQLWSQSEEAPDDYGG